MEPKDLKNSNDELNAKPEVTGDVNTPADKLEQETVAEANPPEALEPTDLTVDEPVENETGQAAEEPAAEEHFDFHQPHVGDPEKEKEEEEEMDEEAANAVIAQGNIDYSDFTEVELIHALRELLGAQVEEDIKDEVDRIRFIFSKKHKAKVDEDKAAFLANGGLEADFEPVNAPYVEEMNGLLNEFRQQRADRMKHQEHEKEQNLEIKYQIIEDIKSLINRKESINKTFHDFRELQQKWRDTGLVPQAKLKDLWETYHHHVENFYDYIKINQELRDLDLKKNMEAKLLLCEKAESLLVEPSIAKAFNTLQKYHEQWREIGPVPRDKREELWERFKLVTGTINRSHSDFFEDRKEDEKKNLDTKIRLCEKVEEIVSLNLESHKAWDDKSKELIEIQKFWKTVGLTPWKENNRIYDRFRTACDKFFDNKREFYAQNREVQQNQLQMKLDLCVQAETMKDSQDWRKTTDDFIRIQKKWKEIGPVPRRQSDIIWKRFRDACDYFFEQKSIHFSSVDHTQVENLEKKLALINEVKAYVLTKDENVDLGQMKDFQRRWTEIGHVPFKEKDRVQNEFRQAVNAHFDHLRIDDHKRNILKFKSKMSNFNESSRGQNKMRFERDKYMTRLKQLESDLTLLNNNIGFFANTKNAESLIEDVNRKIQATEEKIEMLKEKIRIIDAMDDEN
ncbi:MAG: DUF349 domain-containing protein [Mangrovibacterium sp.]